MSVSCSFGLWYDISVKDLGFFFEKEFDGFLCSSLCVMYGVNNCCLSLILSCFHDLER